MGFTWTKAQSDAINARGGEILVSAAAGSGKTAVLTQRVIKRITDPVDRVDVDRMLIVTFTKAAAMEMKERISKKIAEKLMENPADENMQRQQYLLEDAQISTIHSFCMNLIKENFESVGVSSGFRIGEEKQLNVMLNRVLDECIKEQYEKDDKDFFKLVELLSTIKNDNKLYEVIKDLRETVINHPFYERWINELIEGMESGDNFKDSKWYEIIVKRIKLTADYCTDVLNKAYEYMQDKEPLLLGYGPAVQSDIDFFNKLNKAVEEGSWNGICTAVKNIKFITLGRVKDCPDEFKDRVKNARQLCKDEHKKLERYCSISEERYAKDNRYILPLIKKLGEVMLNVDRRFTEEKQRKNILDYNDLEKYTLKLLYTEKDGKIVVSENAKKVAEKYDEIYIDEYQDINEQQEMIFEAIARDNRFMVGDVKQSIYSFRAACPEIFLEKKNSFAKYGSGKFPAKIILSENFRTKAETTTVVNGLCANMFSKEVGDMEYLEEDMLNPRGSFINDYPKPVEMLILGDTSCEESEIVAKRIEELLKSGMPVDSKGEARPVKASDICILLSTRSKAENFAEALKKRKISAFIDKSKGYLGTYEIAPIVSLLKAARNPLLDLSLSECMCSYLFDFNTEDMAELRVKYRDKSIYEAVESEKAEDKRYEAFSDVFSLIRRECVNHSSADVISLIYSVTLAQQKVLVMPDGRQKLENLLMLREYASNYMDGSDIEDFIDYLYSLEEYEYDLEPAMQNGGDGVAIMTIHNSKGLEFPIVFLADTDKRFNITDLAKGVAVNKNYGISSVYKDMESYTTHRTLPHIALGIENRRELLSEKVRILYVALTRAKEKLIISACDNNFKKLSGSVSAGSNSYTMLKANSFYDMLVCGTAGYLGAENLDRVLPENGGCLESKGLIIKGFTDMNSKEEAEDEKESKYTIVEHSEEKKYAAKRQIDWEYPYLEDTETPLKISVSELIGKKNTERKLKKPSFTREKALTATEKGTINHKFMQFADFSVAEKSVSDELNNLVERKFITADEAKAVNIPAIEVFFKSELYKRMKNAEKVHREIRFLKEISAEKIRELTGSEEIKSSTVVQGIADCVIKEADGAVLVDYKTDYVKTPNELIERYKPQLMLYKYIIEELFHITVKETAIYSFSLGKEVYF